MNNKLLLIILTIMGLSIFSCEEDKEIKSNDSFPENSFEAKFIKTFNFIWINNGDINWVNYSHINSSNRLRKSFYNYNNHGGFMCKLYEINHIYNSNNIIESSTFNNTLYNESFIMKYTYNEDKLITKVDIFNSNKLIKTRELFYDKENLLLKVKVKENYEFEYKTKSLKSVLIKKKNTHKVEQSKLKTLPIDQFKEYSLTINNNRIEKIVTKNKTINFYFKDNLLIKQLSKYRDETTSITDLEYDENKRLIKVANNDDSQITHLKYLNTSLETIKYINGSIHHKSLINKNNISFKYINYNIENKKLKYAIEKNKDENNLTYKKAYYEGTVENLELVGYSIVDTRDESSKIKTKETIYDKNDNKLYYIIYEVEDNYLKEETFYNNQDKEIRMYNISESWVQNLLESNLIKVN